MGAILLATPPRAGAALVPTGDNPAGLPNVSCFWTGPFTNTNPVTNTAYPGKYITYWATRFLLPPGSRLVIHGKFSHARYQSWNAYVNGGEATNSVADSATRPDSGSTNPFVAGNRRDLKRRSYALTVLDAPVPGNPRRNTLYAQPDPGGYSEIVYRVYLPDKGRNLAGGEPVPEPGLQLADGTVLRGQALCNAANVNSAFLSPKLPLAVYQGLLATPGKNPATNPALVPPFVEKFWGMPYVLGMFTSPDSKGAATATPAGGSYNNADNDYLTSFLNLKYGRVIVVRAKRKPTTPATYNRETVMRGGQLRYWDWCYAESPVTTRSYDCVSDEDVPTRHNGGFRIVISKKADRPRNARHACGVAWLRFGNAGDGAGNPDAGELLSRSTLASPSFHRAVQNVNKPHTAERVMGPYFPHLRYTSRERYEALSCHKGA